MSILSLFIAASLDGYIAKSQGEIDWLFSDEDYGYTEFFNAIDTVLMGRKTYEQILGFGDYPYRSKIGYVFSRSLMTVHPDHPVTVVTQKMDDFIRNLKQNTQHKIWLVGGSELITECLKYQLIDELILSIHPILLGEGIPLFISHSYREQNLKLQKVIPYSSGLLQLYYTFS